MEKAVSKDILSTQSHEHFMRAQSSWNEIYGRTIADKRNWRTLCFVLALVLLFAIAGLIWQGSQSKVIPYVVVLDKAGQELHTGIAAKSSVVNPKIMKQELGLFIKKNRLASVDRQLMRQNIEWIYAHMLPNTSALKKLNANFRKNNPFQIIKKETRIVKKITSMLPVTDNTWSVEWQEVTRGISDGEILSDEKYNAIITVLKKAPETDKQLKLNPFGIWIIDIEWEKKL
jgi:type IV secretion system protein TrbF